jgi:nuclear pore complex protein Nup205
MSRLPLAQWDPSLFTDLQNLLALVATQPTTSLVRRLNQKLDEARPWILALTALPLPNDEDKKIIASSPISSPDGMEVRVTDDLLVTTNLIADNLNVSHLLAAILALHAMQARPRYPSRSDPEIAIYVLHEALQALLGFVQELLRLTVGPDAEVGQPFDDLRVWIEDLLDEKGASGYLADVVVDQIDAMQSRLTALVRTQASGPGMELLNFRVEAMRTEQNRLAGILQTLAVSGLLKSSQVVKVVKWLKKATRPDAIVAAVFAAFCAATQPLEALEDADPRFETVSAYIRHSKFILVVCNIIVSWRGFGDQLTI